MACQSTLKINTPKIVLLFPTETDYWELRDVYTYLQRSNSPYYFVYGNSSEAPSTVSTCMHLRIENMHYKYPIKLVSTNDFSSLRIMCKLRSKASGNTRCLFSFPSVVETAWCCEFHKLTSKNTPWNFMPTKSVYLCERIYTILKWPQTLPTVYAYWAVR